MWINEPRIPSVALIGPAAPPIDAHNRPRIDDRHASGDQSTPPMGASQLRKAVAVTGNPGEWCLEDEGAVNSVPLVSHTP